MPRFHSRSHIPLLHDQFPRVETASSRGSGSGKMGANLHAWKWRWKTGFHFPLLPFPYSSGYCYFTKFQVILDILRAHKSHQTHIILAFESKTFARKMCFFAEKMANMAQKDRNSAKQRFWNIPSRSSRWNRRPIDGNRPLFFPKAPGISPISCEKRHPKMAHFSRFLQFLGSSKNDPKIDYAREPNH